MDDQTAATPVIRLTAIEALFDKDFRVPSYQRGYRWTPQQVKELLDDIREFLARPEGVHGPSFYCLQPIVVRSNPGGIWEVVDGQQRLTTTFLILRHLDDALAQRGRRRFRLSYETRHASAAFLENIRPEDARRNIDFHHMHQAAQTIEAWFARRDAGERARFTECLLNDGSAGKSVKVIWYELAPSEDPVQAFTRLNVGKIALTDSELIRALFLREANFAAAGDWQERSAIAQEWDEIEKTLQDDDVWYFLYGGERCYANRIEYIFELIAREHEGGAAATPALHETFHFWRRRLEAPDTGARNEWLKVKQYFMRLHEWFRDRTLYHLVGYLVNDGAEMAAIRKDAAALTRSAFRQALKRRIRDRLLARMPAAKNSTANLEARLRVGLDVLDYDTRSQHPTIRSVLLLFNIAALLENGKATMRFPFSHFRKDRWDIEHIRALASAPLSGSSEQRDWLDDLVRYLNAVGVQDDVRSQADELLAQLGDGKTAPGPVFSDAFQNLYRRVRETYDGAGELADDNALGNLTLLDAATNRGYGNAVFPVKRSKIIARDRDGVFVPPCTRNVFLKCYSKRTDHLSAWSPDDRADYFNAIVASLAALLDDGTGAAR
jgi:Arc/MetJ family transcription regulator